MSIIPGFDPLHYSESSGDGVLEMINDLIGQANNNFVLTLIASGKRDGDQVWNRFHEGFALDEDISKLTTFHMMTYVADNTRHHSRH